MIDWNKTSVEDVNLLRAISKRAIKLKQDMDYITLDMDIAAAHITNPLKLKELLKADDFNFMHDIIGITNNIDRDTGEMSNYFLPKYSA